MKRRGEGTQRLLGIAMGLGAAWLAFDVLVFLYGEAPGPLLRELWAGTWGTPYGAGQVLFKATPLLFCGVAVEVALRAGLFNIGAEGQLAVASLAVALVGARLPAAWPRTVGVPVLLLVAASAGGAWALIPAWLRVGPKTHEVISTILMNRVAGALVGFLFGLGAALPGTVRTADVAASGRLPRLDVWVSALRGSAVSLALLLAVLAAVLVGPAFRHLRVPREAALVGKNPVACRAAGIPVAPRLVAALVASGALAGLASTATVLGYKGYAEDGLGAGAGFGGVAVALLAQRAGKASALGLVGSALLFGTFQQGGLALNARVPMELMDVLQAVVLVAVTLASWRGAPSGGPGAEGATGAKS